MTTKELINEIKLTLGINGIDTESLDSFEFVNGKLSVNGNGFKVIAIENHDSFDLYISINEMVDNDVWSQLRIKRDDEKDKASRKG